MSLIHRSLLLLAGGACLVSVGAAHAQPITGVYVAGAIGGNFLESERLTTQTNASTTAPGTGHLGFKNGGVGLASIGYAFGNGIRLELEGSYRKNDVGAPILGATSQTGSEAKTSGMVNALFDFDIGNRYIFPYIGGGIGYASTRLTETITGPDGAARMSGTVGSFAYQAIGGIAFPIPGMVGLSVTTEYRYFALQGGRNFAGTAASGGSTVAFGRRLTDDRNQVVTLGLRYAFNVPPPVLPAVAAPAPAANRSFLVFFDWDSVALSARARQILAEVSQAARQADTTRVALAGNADRTGTAAYNRAISLRRAQAVAAELVRLGVPASAISMQANGDSQPLVATQAGVREPQNRRVEIVLDGTTKAVAP